MIDRLQQRQDSLPTRACYRLSWWCVTLAERLDDPRSDRQRWYVRLLEWTCSRLVDLGSWLSPEHPEHP